MRREVSRKRKDFLLSHLLSHCVIFLKFLGCLVLCRLNIKRPLTNIYRQFLNKRTRFIFLNMYLQSFVSCQKNIILMQIFHQSYVKLKQRQTFRKKLNDFSSVRNGVTVISSFTLPTYIGLLAVFSAKFLRTAHKMVVSVKEFVSFVFEKYNDRSTQQLS